MGTCMPPRLSLDAEMPTYKLIHALSLPFEPALYAFNTTMIIL
jgi:hypothetical protein